MSEYVDDLVRRWEMADPRDRWKHTGERAPRAQNDPLPGWKPTEETARDVERMLVCGVCGGEACFGFGLTLEGIRMGDVGSWRCAEHHPTREPWYSREAWAQARAAGALYPLPVDQPAEAAE